MLAGRMLVAEVFLAVFISPPFLIVILISLSSVRLPKPLGKGKELYQFCHYSAENCDIASCALLLIWTIPKLHEEQTFKTKEDILVFASTSRNELSKPIKAKQTTIPPQLPTHIVTRKKKKRRRRKRLSIEVSEEKTTTTKTNKGINR